MSLYVYVQCDMMMHIAQQKITWNFRFRTHKKTFINSPSQVICGVLIVNILN